MLPQGASLLIIAVVCDGHFPRFHFLISPVEQIIEVSPQRWEWNLALKKCAEKRVEEENHTKQFFTRHWFCAHASERYEFLDIAVCHYLTSRDCEQA